MGRSIVLDGVRGVFVGFKINPLKDNPYAPSAISAGFAMTNSSRYIELTLSGEQGTLAKAVLGEREESSSVLANWDEYTKESSATRRIRYIYTGNLLQAFAKVTSDVESANDKASARGKLISFTCKNGEVRKGILMPEAWNPHATGGSATTRLVPLKFCRRAVLSLSKGSVLTTDADIDFLMMSEGIIRIITRSLNMQKFGWLVKHEALLPVIRENGGFQKTGATWTGSVESRDLDRAIDIIYEESRCNAQLSAAQMDIIKNDIVRTEVKPTEKAVVPDLTKPDDDKARRLKLIKLKAKALKIKLQLLALDGLFGDDSIPKGNTSADVNARRNIIKKFYKEWMQDNDHVYNYDLKDDIYVSNFSVTETAHHAATQYKSTLSVLKLTEILSNARLINISAAKKGNQQRFTLMYKMVYCDLALGSVIQLIVGKLKSAIYTKQENNKIQYCITAIKNEQNDSR